MTVQIVKIERLVLLTEQPEEFIDALEALCQHHCSGQDPQKGDGYTFKFDVEEGE